MNYVDSALPYVLSEGERLLDNDFIYQQFTSIVQTELRSYWDKVKNYRSLFDGIKKRYHLGTKSGLIRSVENWSSRILSILKTKGARIK